MQILRCLPSVRECLESDSFAAFRAEQESGSVSEVVRNVIDDIRQQLQSRPADDQHDTDSLRDRLKDEVIARTLLVLKQQQLNSGTSVINATGVILHTNLGRSPLSAAARAAVHDASGYCNLELSLSDGKRIHRGGEVCRLLASLCGAEAALVVNNCAAATWLVLNELCREREVVLSRGQLVEIGGGYRLPEIIAASGAVLREVGTTNRTYVRDYENSVSEHTAAILRVHRSNFEMRGFVHEPSIEHLAAPAREHGILLIDDIGSGCVTDLSRHGLREPLVQDSVRSGADIVMFSGDKLFGGPQAGIIVGRTDLVERLKRNPLARAFRADKMTLAALETTTGIHLSGRSCSELPALRMIAESPETTADRTKRLLSLIPEGAAAAWQPADMTAEPGGGSGADIRLPSAGLTLRSDAAEEYALRLRTGTPAVVGYIHEGRLHLDLRTVTDEELPDLAQALTVLAQAGLPAEQ